MKTAERQEPPLPWAGTWEDRPGTLPKETHGFEIMTKEGQGRPKNVTVATRTWGSKSKSKDPGVLVHVSTEDVKKED